MEYESLTASDLDVERLGSGAIAFVTWAPPETSRRCPCGWRRTTAKPYAEHRRARARHERLFAAGWLLPRIVGAQSALESRRCRYA
jgi:hypothetical protein